MQTAIPNRRTAEDHFEVVIRLRQSRISHPSDATLRLRAQALLKDILMSRLEVEAEINAHEYVRTRGFGDLGRALAASRALQIAFEGFRSVPGPRANLSVILDSPGPDESVSGQAGLTVEQKDLLDFAKPSQVLITQAFYDRIAPYQPALRSSPLRAGVYEFLWTGEQRLNELQAEAEFMPTLIQPPPAADLVAETIIAPAVKSAPTSRWKEPDRAYAPPPEIEPAPVSVDQPPTRWLSAPRVLGVSAVTILCVIGYLVSSLHFGNSAKPAPQVTQQVKPSPFPQQQEPVPTAPSKAVVPPRPDAHKVIPPTIVKPPVPAGVASDGALASQQTGSKIATRSRNCSIEVADIPRYLNYAESNSSKGQYERAISEYNQVLGCQPGNRVALDGLRKAQDAEKYSSR